MGNTWFEYKCPTCKTWVESTNNKEHRCYECGTNHQFVREIGCCLCDRTIKRQYLIVGRKHICDTCRKEHKIGS